MIYELHKTLLFSVTFATGEVLPLKIEIYVDEEKKSYKALFYNRDTYKLKVAFFPKKKADEQLWVTDTNMDIDGLEMATYAALIKKIKKRFKKQGIKFSWCIFLCVPCALGGKFIVVPPFFSARRVRQAQHQFSTHALVKSLKGSVVPGDPMSRSTGHSRLHVL
ncbi:MAG: hypothetical protein ABI579_04860 [Candidatus Sumerlaeota bacterium]